jgi:PAS domain S-box-containing protein
VTSSASVSRTSIGVIAVVAAVFALTLAVPDHVAVWLLYAVPLLLSARMRSARAPYWMAAAITILMLAVLPFQRHSGVALEILVLNRALEAGIFWIAAILIARNAAATKVASEQAAHLARAQQVAAVGSWERDITHDRLVWSEEMHRICETDPAVEPTFDNFMAIVHPDDRQIILDSIARAEIGRLRTMEYRLLLSGGRVKHVQTRSHRFEKDGLATMGGTMQDITERKLAELARKASEAQLERQTEQMSIALGIVDMGLWKADLHTGVLELIHAGGHVLSMPPESRPRTIEAYFGLVHPADREMLQQKYAVAARDNKPYRADYRIVTPAGERWLAAYAYMIRDAAGNPVEVVGADLDITDRKAAEHARAQQVSLVRSAEDAILTGALNGTVTSWNLAAQRMFGYSEEEIVGRSLLTLIPADRSPESMRNIARIAAGETVRGYETTRLRKDGTQIRVSLTISPIFDENGLVEGASFIARDLTDRERVAEQLRALSRRLESAQEAERSAIARDLHDDLGQSLLAIRLEMRRLLDLIDRASPAATLVRELETLVEATMARTRSIALALHPSAIDDLGLGAAICILARRIGEVSGLRFHLDVDEDLELDSGLATAAYRVLQESVTNVVRHAGASEVSIMLERRGDDAVLEITDDGRGIRRAEQESSESLGLLGMRERAALIHGDLTVEPAGSRGTRVLLRFPAPRIRGAA